MCKRRDALKTIIFNFVLLFWFELLICSFLLIWCTESKAGNVFSVKKDAVVFYLIGSSHKPMPQFQKLPKHWVEILDTASTICFESINQDPNKTMLEYESIATKNSDVQTKKIVNTKIFNRALEILVSKFGLSENMIARMSTYSPYFFADAFASFVPTTIVEAKSIDDLLQEKANELGIASNCVVEKISESLSSGNTVNLKESENYLNYGIKLFDNKSAYEKMVHQERLIDKNYFDGNLEEICQIEANYYKKNKIFPILQKTIFERNSGMLKSIQLLTESKNNVVIAVGALHLCGKQGLVSRLRESGYIVADIEIK